MKGEKGGGPQGVCSSIQSLVVGRRQRRQHDIVEFATFAFQIGEFFASLAGLAREEGKGGKETRVSARVTKA